MSAAQIIEELVTVREKLPMGERKRFQQIINQVATDEFYIQKLIAWYEDDNNMDYDFEVEMMHLIQNRNGEKKGGDNAHSQF